MANSSRTRPPQRSRPSKRSPACRRVPRHGLARRQRVAQGEPRRSPLGREGDRSSSGTSRTGPRGASSPAAAARSPWSSTEPDPAAVQRPVLPAPDPRRQRGAVRARPAARPPDAGRRGRRAPHRATTSPPATSTAHPRQPARRRPAARPHSPRRRALVVGRPPAAGHDRDLRRRRQPRTARGRAVEHLIAGGRRRGRDDRRPQDMVAGIDRLAGYRDALAERGSRPTTGLTPSATSPRRAATRAMERLLAARPDLDAVFCGIGPDGGRRPRRPAVGRPSRARRTSRSSATTTRRSPRPRAPPSPASASRSRRWAARWHAC